MRAIVLVLALIFAAPTVAQQLHRHDPRVVGHWEGVFVGVSLRLNADGTFRYLTGVQRLTGRWEVESVDGNTFVIRLGSSERVVLFLGPSEPRLDHATVRRTGP